jgi:hypothetical protein
VPLGRHVSGERKGRGGPPFGNQAVGWVIGSWRESALTPLGPVCRWQIGLGAAALLDFARRPSFSKPRKP